MKTIIHAVHIHAAPRQVYDALTTAEGLSQWWTTQVAVETGPGGIIRFTFHGDFHPHMQQIALEPHRLVRWSCVAGHPNWQNNTFSFTLEDRQGETSPHRPAEHPLEEASALRRGDYTDRAMPPVPGEPKRSTTLTG